MNSSGTADRLSDSHDGRVTDDDRAWLADELAGAERPVVLVHHNSPAASDQVEAHRGAEPEMALPPAMRDPDLLAATLAEGGVDVAFTGHYHLPATGEYSGVREVAAPTTCSFPQAYPLCETTPEGTTVRFVPVADEAGLGRAHALRTADSATARGLTAVAAARVASFPLVDESAAPPRRPR